ncbi:sugar phosphate isomerase/epimerase [uncultured Ruminococcus sp.]|uniref:sugar phosphate isomerase/epimerase family protein n=1 Tax=uncultured Ruminococcus sp. TaxID=165186 RepID=UPI0026041B80|nr:sugar phosphate isomerase/epimerase [uncultured Ruminococcus sp.]
MLRAGVSTACLYPRVVEEALYDLALAGVSHVEIFINTHAELRRNFVDTLAQVMQRFEMTCRSLHPFTSEMEPMMLFSNYPRRVEDYLEYCRHYFTAMQRLGAEVFVLHGNKVPAGTVNRELYFERFRRLAELGESYGVIVAQENVARCTSASSAFLKEMCGGLGKQARFVLDVKQAVRSGEDPLAMLKLLGSHVVHVHISDHGQYGDCLPIGKGRFRVNAFLETLAEVSPDCSVILELYRSGFSDVSELASNYTLLQNRIHAIQKGGV